MEDRKLALLVRRAIKGDMEAFEEVYFAHAQAVLFHVRNQIIDKDNYQDVAQDVALTLWKSIGQLRKPAAFRGWMHQIIRNTCASHNRALLKEREKQSTGNNEEIIDELPAETTGIDGDPALVALQKDDEHKLFAAIETLPPAYREAITLRYYDELSYKEIAKVLNISTSAVGTNILRGTEYLKKLFNAEEEAMQREEQNITNLTEVGKDIPNKGEPKQQPKRKGEGMSTHKRDIQTGAAVAGAFAVTDESIKNSLDVGVNELVPPEVVDLYTKEAHLNLMSAKIAGASAAAGAAVAVKAGGNIFLGIISTLFATVALVVGVYGVSVAGLPDGIFETIGSEQIEKTIQYKGDPHIIFTTAEGGSGPYDVISISLEDAVSTPASISWTVVTPEGKEVLAGLGALIDASVGLEDLEVGEYKANFILTDEQGATAHSSRTFTVE